MSSPSPVPSLSANNSSSNSNRDPLSVGILGPSRRVSLMMNSNTPGGSGQGANRSLTPPSSSHQQQTSPNSSFLAGLSSRLVSSRNQGSSAPSASSQYPGMGSGRQGVSGSGGGAGAGGLPDIFDTAGLMGPSGGGAPGGGVIGFSGFRGGSAGLGSINSSVHHHHQNNFGIPTGSGPPSTFDINEFPSLGGSGGLGGHTLSGGNAPGSNRPNYVGQVVKDIVGGGVSANHHYDHPKSTFNMDELDFPALPGSGAHSREPINDNSFTHGLTNNYQLRQASLSSGGESGTVVGGSSLGLGSGDGSNANAHKAGKRGIQTTKEGRVTNIPMGMVTDQFGMIGLLAFIRVADTDQNLVSLALGTDLTTLKLDLNSSDNLYSTFPGPWSDHPLKPHEIDFPVPSEYLIYNQIRDKLAPIKLSRYGDDTLFFLFYMFPCDLIQIAAASELYVRDWRYHKDEKVWITRAPGMPPIEKTQTYERGTYYFFDHLNWRRVAKEFHLDYDRLENRPAAAGYNQNSVAAGTLIAS